MGLKNLPYKSRRGIVWKAYYYLKEKGISVRKHKIHNYLIIMTDLYKIIYYPLAQKYIITGYKELNDDASTVKDFYSKIEKL